MDCSIPMVYLILNFCWAWSYKSVWGGELRVQLCLEEIPGRAPVIPSRRCRHEDRLDRDCLNNGEMIAGNNFSLGNVCIVIDFVIS